MKRLPALLALATCALLAAVACGTDSPEQHVQGGTGYVQEKRYQEAILEFRSALQLDPRLGSVRVKLAEAYMAVNDRNNALREYIRAADLLPDDAAVQLTAGGFLLAARMFEDASGRAQRVLDRDPKNVDALVLKGNALAGLREFEAAIDEYEAAISTDPERHEPYLSLGTVQQSQGHSAEAEASFLKAVELDPRSVPARLALASYHWANRNLAKSEEALTGALQIDPQNIVANRAMGTFYVMTGRAPAAERYFVAVAKASPTPPVIMSLAQYYVTVNRKDQARRVLTELAQRDDGYADATVRLATLDVADGNRAAAQTRIREVLSKQPKHVRALIQDAESLLAEENYDEALKQATAALAAEPNSAAAHQAAGRIYQATDRIEVAIKEFEQAVQADPNAFVAILQLARLHLPRAPDKSTTYARQALSLRPSSAEAAALLARSQIARGDVNAARPLISQLQKGAPNSALAHKLEAALLVATKQPDRARLSYAKALEVSPTDLEVLNGLVGLDLAAGRTQAAISRVDAVLGRSPRDADLLMFAAGVYAQGGQAERSERTLLEAIEKSPSRVRPYGQLGQLYASQNRLEEAVKQFEQILVRDPRSVSASTILGTLHERRGDMAAAERTYQRALSIDARASMAANNLAYLWASSNRNLDQALELAQTAQQQFPNDPRLADTLGWVYVKKNLATLAVPHLLAGARMMTSDPAVHYHLGIAYLQTGELAKAKAALEKALSLKPDFDGAANARQALESIGV